MHTWLINFIPEGGLKKPEGQKSPQFIHLQTLLLVWHSVGLYVLMEVGNRRSIDVPVKIICQSILS